jgi:hypothetical protein
MVNAADKRGLAQRDAKAERREAQLDMDLLLLLKQPEFRRFAGWMLAKFDPIQSSFDTNGSIENFKLGRQAAGVELWLRIEKVQPDAVITIRHAWQALEEKKDA